MTVEKAAAELRQVLAALDPVPLHHTAALIEQAEETWPVL